MEKNLILTKAKGAEMSHDFTTAARMYKQLLDDEPSNVDYLKSLANIYVQAGEDEKAIPYFEQIIAYYPHYVEAMNSLGAIYRRLKRYEESIAILERALQEGRQLPSINYNLGFTQKEMGNYKDAIASFQSVISVNPNDVLAHNHLGSIYLALKDYPKSIAAYKRGLQIDQNHPILNYNLARCYEASKNIPDAIRCYGLALKTRPGWQDAIKDFSSLLIKCQKNKEAQDLVQKSIALHPNDVDMLCKLGQIYLNEYDYDNAVRTFKKASGIKEDDVKILTGLAKAYEKADKNDQAIETILDALDIDPDNKGARKQYAHSQLTAKDYDGAFETVQGLYNEEGGKEDLEVLDLYGQYYICNGEDDKAKGCYKEIQKINHHYKDHLISAAERSAQIGKIEQAEQYANDYVARRPQNPDGYMTLGKIYEQKGDLVGAKNFFGKTASMNSSIVLAQKKVSELTDKLNDVTQFVPLQDIEVEEKIEETVVDETPVVEESTEKDADNFDFEQMGTTPLAEMVEPDTDSYFNKLADNLEEDFANEVEEDDDTFEIQDPDKMDLADEESAEFNFDQEEDAKNPLKEDTGEDFFKNEDYTPEKVLPQMEQMQDEAKESANAAKEAVDDAKESANAAKEAVENAQKLVDELNEQKQKLQDELQAQQEMLREQLQAQNQALQEQLMQNAQNAVKEAVCDFLETDAQPEETPPETPVPPQPPVQEPVAEEEPVVEEEPVPEEPSIFDFEPEVEEEPEPEPEPEPQIIEETNIVEEQIQNEVEPEIETEPEVEISEEPEIDIESETEIPEEPVTEEESEIQEEPAEEQTIEPEIEPESEPEQEEESIEITTDFSEDPYVEQETEYDETLIFYTVEDLFEEEPAEEPVVEEEPFAEDESIEETPVTEEDETNEEEIPEGISEEDMLERIQKILNDDDLAAENAEKLELFKRLRILSSYLPENEKNSFKTCRVRMMIEYIISKLSGRPGLLLTAQSLIKSGVLGDEYETQLTKGSELEMGNELIRKVVKDMKKMAENLEDESLAKSLSVTADGILEQIELRNQKSEIF